MPENQDLPPHPVLKVYYESAEARRTALDRMFDSAAEHYDWITDVMSFGSGRWYRNQALTRAGLKPGDRIIDVGAGTGVISLLAQQLVGPDGEVIALDPSRGMLGEARSTGVKLITQGLAEALPFPDDYFDMLTMGYALRHVSDLHCTFGEYLRVLKPGGKVLLLEISRPKTGLATLLVKTYLKGVVPNFVRVFRRSVDAKILMQYYWDTIESCVAPAEIVGALANAGFLKASRHVVLGIFSEYTGVKE